MTFQQLTDALVRLYDQRKYAEALELVEQNADHFPVQRARTTFWRMCLLSLSGRPNDMISLFRQGLDSGLWWAEQQFVVETDFDPVRELPEFKQLVAESERKCAEMQEQVKPDRSLLLPDTTGELPLLIALHGRNGNKNQDIEYWDVARRRGWLVLLPQSRQALFEGAYCWDNREQGLNDILFHVKEIMQTHNVDRRRVVIGGFSQGSGMGIYTALSDKTDANGFIGIGTWWQNPADFAAKKNHVRGYFVTGEKDHTLDRAREIQKVLKENNIRFTEEVHPDLGHAFPADFERAFDQAIDFIFKEHE
jgi:dienelactone hydrolase